MALITVLSGLCFTAVVWEQVPRPPRMASSSLCTQDHHELQPSRFLAKCLLYYDGIIALSLCVPSPHHHPRFVLLTPTPTLHRLLNSYLFTKRLKGSKSPTEDISCFHCCRLFFEIVSHFVVLLMRTFLFGQKDYKMPLVLEWDSLSHLTN